MTDTPNTSRPSEAIQRYETDVRGEDRDPYPLDTDDEGRFVLHCDHLAALARAREEARREALEEVLCLMYERDDLPWSESLAIAIRALAVPTPTPQRESRVDQKRPPHPEELVNALQDRVHPASGPLIQSKPVTPQGETKEND